MINFLPSAEYILKCQESALQFDNALKKTALRRSSPQYFCGRLARGRFTRKQIARNQLFQRPDIYHTIFFLFVKPDSYPKVLQAQKIDKNLAAMLKLQELKNIGITNLAHFINSIGFFNASYK